MAKLSPEIRETINQLRQKLIDIIDDATATEFILFERYGETERTIIVLDEIKNVAQDASSTFNQLCNLQLRIAESQPTATSAIIELLTQAITRTQNRLPAWERSIEEVKLDWNLS